jgi:uncharacterized protein (TIGR03086 family)
MCEAAGARPPGRVRENRWPLTTSGILGQDRLDEQARDGRREAFRILLDPDFTAGDFSATFRQQSSRLVAAFDAPGAMDATMKMPFGGTPGSVCAYIAATDIFTHGWDLARATAQSTDLEPDLAGMLLARIMKTLPDSMRGSEGEAPFGPRVEVAKSAPPADQLAAFQGRQP